MEDETLPTTLNPRADSGANDPSRPVHRNFSRDVGGMGPV